MGSDTEMVNFDQKPKAKINFDNSANHWWMLSGFDFIGAKRNQTLGFIVS